MGTSLIFPELAPVQSDVVATPYTPEGLAANLLGEFVLGSTLAASLLNHADPASATSAPVTALAITAAGSGGTNGTFAIAFTGGGGTGAAGTFTVAGGIVTAVALTSAGSGYTSVPTAGLAASSGLTGATVTAKTGMPVSAGTPTVNTHSVTLLGTAQFDTGLVPFQQDQLWMMVSKKPTGATSGDIIKAGTGTSGTGFLLNTSGQALFYNSQSGSAGVIAAVTYPHATNFCFFAGWGRLGSVGHIVTGTGGVLSSVVDGSGAGLARPSANGGTTPTAKLGQGSGGLQNEIAAYARVDIGNLLDTQILALIASWYSGLYSSAILGVTMN